MGGNGRGSSYQSAASAAIALQHGMRAGAIKYAWPKRRGASEAQTEEITKDEATDLNFALVEGSEEVLE